MADVFSNSLRVREQESGSNAGTWGSLLNTTIRNIASAFGQGSETIPNASTHTITLADGVADEARSMYLKCTGGGQACTVTLAPNTISKVWIISNETSATLTFSQGSGANVAITAGAVKVIVTDGAGSGAAVVDALSGLSANVSDLTTTGDISFGDNDKAIFGAGSDLQIYHDGTHSNIKESGAGDLQIFGDNVNIYNAAGSQNLINLTSGGANTFFHNGSAKLATTSTGIAVTGNASFADNGKAIFGAGSDLALYHDGSNSYIKDQGTGDLYIQGEANVRITDGDGNKMFLGQNDGEVQLYYNGAEKLNTTSTGIDVTGGVTTNANSYLNGLRVGGADTGNTIYQPTGDLSISSASGSIFLKPSGTSVLTATSTGIDVTGNITLSDAVPTLKFTDTDNNYDATIQGLSGSLVLTADSGAEFGTESIQFKTGGTEAMRISGGNLLVGGTDTFPHDNSGTSGTAIGASGYLSIARSGGISGYFNRMTDDGDIIQFRQAGAAVGSIGSNSGFLYIGCTEGNDAFLSFGSDGVRPATSAGAARDAAIDLGGSDNRFKDLHLAGIANIGTNLLVGTTTTGSGAQSGVAIAGGASSSDIYIRHANGTSSGAVYASFIYNTSEIGKISQNGTSQVLYQVSSDQRLKSNIANAAEDAGELIDAIQVRQFDWIADGEHQRYGMIAQELQTVAPEAVGGDPDSDEMMGVDYSKLVPMLVKEIQSLRNRVAQLES
jgi:hypothetical protein